jgi:hypothetical protein
LLLQLVYFLTYGVNYEQSIFTGVAIAGLRLTFARPAAAERSPQPV